MGENNRIKWCLNIQLGKQSTPKLDSPSCSHGHQYFDDPQETALHLSRWKWGPDKPKTGTCRICIYMYSYIYLYLFLFISYIYLYLYLLIYLYIHIFIYIVDTRGERLTMIFGEPSDNPQLPQHPGDSHDDQLSAKIHPWRNAKLSELDSST